LVLRDYLCRDVVGAKNVRDRRSEEGNSVEADSTEMLGSERRQSSLVKENKPPRQRPDDSGNLQVAFDRISRERCDLDLGLRESPLLVGGHFLKTDQVEYFPNMEKYLTDSKTTRAVIGQAKKGVFPEGWRNFVSARYFVGNDGTNQDAIAAAYEAAREFSRFPLVKRYRIMCDIYDLLVAKERELIDLMAMEGHPVSLAAWEYHGMRETFHPHTLKFFKDEMVREMGAAGGDDVFIMRRPDGVVCLSTPKNAPCSIPIIAAFSLLSGNTIIVKPPLRTPVACSFLWQEVVYAAARANGAPAGVVNTVVGNSEKIMREWMESPLTHDIFYFGDSKLGLAIGEEAFRRGKKPILELSGNDFMLVWHDAQIEPAVESLVDGFRGSLQICMAPKKAFVHPAVFDKFCERVVSAVKGRVKAGLPSDPATFLTPVTKIRECESALGRAIEQGAELLTGGHRIDHTGMRSSDGVFFEATVVAIKNGDPMKFECVAEENFFPLMPLITLPGHPTDEEVFQWMTALAERNEYSLRISVWSGSRYWISRFAQQVSNCGLLRINSPHTGFSTYLGANGGARKSGGPFGEMNYPWLKTSRLQGVSIRW
jgi:acyl-CoA reductase-like NAD-dependent aldehyde dehydrogenase